MLSQSETAELIGLAQTGDERAKNVLIEQNMPLVISIVKRYRGRGVEYDDLIQLGSIGLLKAVVNFDMKFAVKFSTYAVPMIVGEIKRFIRDDGVIKVSRAIKITAYKIARYINEFTEINKKSPTIDEISENLGIDKEEIVFAMDSAKTPVSLFHRDDEDALQIIDKIPDNSSEIMLDKVILREVIDKLDEREKKIIMLRYFRDKTQNEIAEEMGVSQVQISRLENKILKKLRELLEIDT